MTLIVRDLESLKLIAKGLENRLPVGNSLHAIAWAINEIEVLQRQVRQENDLVVERTNERDQAVEDRIKYYDLGHNCSIQLRHAQNEIERLKGRQS